MTKITPKEKFNLGNRILLDKTLSSATRLVGWYIADHIHTRHGYAWPPQTTIANDLGISLRAVNYAVKSLAPYFNINISHGPGRASRYRIGAKFAPIEVVIRAKSAPSKRKICTIKGAKSAHYPLTYPLNDPLTTSTDVDGARGRSKKRRGNQQEQEAATEDGFQKFWESYPRKVAKKAAEKAFARAVKETTLEQMLAALAIDKKDWKEERFTPHPATWLNGGRYLDHEDKLKPLKTYRPPNYRDD